MNRKSRSRKSKKTSSSRNKSPKRSSRRKCKVVTRKKVCGPSPSCRYPNAYLRKQILKLASKDEDIKDEYGDVTRVRNEQLCSALGLMTRESVQFNRIIEGRKCGPEPSRFNPNVWTKDELLGYIYENDIIQLTKARVMHREDLCVVVADWSYKNRKSKAEFKLPEAGTDLYPLFSWNPGPQTTPAFVYFLLTKYPDSYFFVDRSTSPAKFSGIRYKCREEQLIVNPNLISEMKKCKVRFFFTLISLRKKQEGEVGKHANLLLYDKKLNEIWHYEPLRGGKYRGCNKDPMFSELSNLFKRELNPNIKFISAPEYCPRLNLSRLIYKQKHKGFNPEGISSGLCIAVNLWMVDNRLSHPNMTVAEVNTASLKALHEHEYGAINHILNWIKQIVDLRSNLLSTSKNKRINESDYLAGLVKHIEQDRISA
jgi:hypothetical protein